jgi:hypothetical protein
LQNWRSELNLTQNLVRELFEYQAGTLYWRVSPAKNVRAGDAAGFTQGNGYRGVVIHRKIYPLHRVIFLHCHGYLPEIVDHADGNILNNQVENLRAATIAANGANRRVNRNSSSGVKNVTRDKLSGKWHVRLQKNRRSYYFGAYDALKDAADAAMQARRVLYGEFARHS